MDSQAEDWNRLAEAVKERRADLGMTQADVAHAGSLSLDRVQKIEAAGRTSYRRNTLRALERALRWSPHSVDAVLAGGEPTSLGIKVVEIGQAVETDTAPSVTVTTREPTEGQQLYPDDPALAAIWDIQLLTEDERSFLITRLRFRRLKDQAQQEDITPHERRA